MVKNLPYPSNAKFAFTILDDTDDTTVKNGRPVYNLLNGLGYRTTKTVWSFDTPSDNQGPYFEGETLTSAEYMEWIHKLFSQNFEIAFHNATMGSSPRQDTIRALDMLNNEFDQQIRLHCNHGQNRENLHWGVDRYHSYLIRKALSFATKKNSNYGFEGNNPHSPYFWSDIADRRLSYMRAFTYNKLNGAQIPPGRPYLDTSKQKNILFFNTSDAPDVFAFNKLVNPASIDKLHEQNGWCIISTHLGKGFFNDNTINAEFKNTMEYMASLPGWFVPVSQLLDFLRSNLDGTEISPISRTHMEYAHIIDRIKGRLYG